MSITRAITTLFLFAAILSACVGPSAQAVQPPPEVASAPTATPAPTASPMPTEMPRIAAGVRVAGIDVGRMTLDEARAKLTDASNELNELVQPITLQAGTAQASLPPEDIGLTLDLNGALAEAQQASAGAQVAASLRYNEDQLRSALDAFGHEAATPPAISVLTDTDPMSRSFVLTPGQKLDVDAAVAQVAQQISAADATRSISLTLLPDTSTAARPSPEQLQEQIEALAAEWEGVVGLYAYDLDKDQPLAKLHSDTVFSGASVMKVPIMLNLYLNKQEFDEQEQEWLERMIIKSDNLAANGLMAASAGGAGTDDALKGVLQMDDMLRDLGLNYTYQYIPYEAYEYLVGIRKVKIKQGPAFEGPKPYTEADPFVRTTPAEMSQVFLWIYDCSRGKGLLLDKFPDKLTPERCQEMIDLLKRNDDHIRMVAGLPPGTDVAHKSGWTEDMHSDVGIVQSPGGNFLLGIYVYYKITQGKNYLSDEVGGSAVASFARLVYSYYNPTVLNAPSATQAAEPTATSAEPTAAPAATDEEPTATSSK